MDRINAGKLRRNLNGQFHGVALRPAGHERAAAAMRAVERIAAALLAVSHGVRWLCGKALAVPARTIADASMGAAENVARVIIKTVDVAQHHRDARG